MFEHLDNPEYLHTLLNPLPVYGLAVGALALLGALISRTRAARVTGLSIIFFSALTAWPVHHYGEESFERILVMTDPDGGQWLNEHRHRAEKFTYVFYVVAALAALSIVAEFRAPRAAMLLALLTLVLAATSVGVGGHIATAGGRVRHREFRYEPPPEPRAEQNMKSGVTPR